MSTSAKRYWFILVGYANNIYDGKMNLGFVSDENNPLNNQTIRNEVLKAEPELHESGLVIENIYEFTSEEDYINFWKKD